MHPKISIILIGNNHLDFKLYPILCELLNQLNDNGIPTAFLEEHIGIKNLKEAITSSIILRELGKKYKNIAHSFLSNFFNHDELTNLEYLKASDDQAIIEKVEANMDAIKTELKYFISPSSSSEFVKTVRKLNTGVESLKLYNLLKRLNIFYSSIEPHQEEFHSEIIESSSIPVIAKYESYRINNMLTKVLEACEHFKDGGVVFVFVGAAHAHRLAANIFLSAQKNLELSKCIEIHTFKAYSNIVSEGSSHSQQLHSFMKFKVDSPEILEIYSKLPLQTIRLSETQSSFSELDVLVQKLIQKSSKKANSSLAPISMFNKKLSPHQQIVGESSLYSSESP